MSEAAWPVIYPLAGRRVWVAGHNGLVGSALVRRLKQAGVETLTADRAALDLRDQAAVAAWLAAHRPEQDSSPPPRWEGSRPTEPARLEFLYNNLQIAANIIHAASEAGVSKLMFLGSSCYPREAEQPIREETMLTGPFEPTNEWYAVAKVAGVKLCQAYRRQYGKDLIAVVPTNLYGPGDNFDLASSHVIPAMIRKIHEGKAGKGGPVTPCGQRAAPEFVDVDDAAEALVFLMERYN